MCLTRRIPTRNHAVDHMDHTMLADTLRLTKPTRGRPFAIASHFRAQSFCEDQFGGAMDPLLMVDHFRMSEPTFGPHHHAGFSAVTYVLEDSRSAHQNTDSMGNNLPINLGSLHWMVAGRGIRKQLRRADVLTFFAKLEPRVVGMEACGAGRHGLAMLVKEQAISSGIVLPL